MSFIHNSRGMADSWKTSHGAKEHRLEAYATLVFRTAGTSCLATIVLSLRDKNHPLIEAPLIILALTGERLADGSRTYHCAIACAIEICYNGTYRFQPL
jgi:hypothetical protein